MWVPMPNPSQELLDQLYKEALTDQPCNDCGAEVGEPHVPGCDVARCTICGGQDISCDCEDAPRPFMQLWEGLWPGKKDAYEEGLVTVWSRTGVPSFDLNEVFSRRLAGTLKRQRTFIVYRHIKTGKLYQVLHFAKDCTNERDGEDTVVYKLAGSESEKVFVRSKKEFEEKFQKYEWETPNKKKK
jgi:hypothetical protein